MESNTHAEDSDANQQLLNRIANLEKELTSEKRVNLILRTSRVDPSTFEVQIADLKELNKMNQDQMEDQASQIVNLQNKITALNLEKSQLADDLQRTLVMSEEDKFINLRMKMTKMEKEIVKVNNICKGLISLLMTCHEVIDDMQNGRGTIQNVSTDEEGGTEDPSEGLKELPFNQEEETSISSNQKFGTFSCNNTNVRMDFCQLCYTPQGRKTLHGISKKGKVIVETCSIIASVPIAEKIKVLEDKMHCHVCLRRQASSHSPSLCTWLKQGTNQQERCQGCNNRRFTMCTSHKKMNLSILQQRAKFWEARGIKIVF